MPRGWVIVCLSVTWVALVIANGESPAPSPPPPVHPGNASAQELASCSARGCHGGSLPDVKINALGIKEYGAESRNAATAWLRHDKHARAYAILSEPKAFAIMRLLDQVPPGEEPRPAWKEERCLACHATPTAAHELADGDVFVDNGFSCEACHGADSRKYLVAHQTQGYFPPGKNLEKAYKDYGMTWLNDPASRAQLCVGCHVGAPPIEKDGKVVIPLRDMNHDMIAAGHPRLTFEFASYLRNMPPHWQERDRTKSDSRLVQRSAFEDWLVGQQATATAALQLLETRASSASAQWKNAPASSDWRTMTPWPEFAEYDCYSCHRGLAGRTGRDAMQFYPPDANPRDQRPGGLVMSNWAWSLPYRQLMAKAVDSVDDIHRALRIDMASNVPDPDAVAKYAAQARGLLARRMPSAADLLAAIELPGNDAAKSGGKLRWDDAAQLYYAWAAAYVTRPEALQAAAPLLRDLHDKLRFKVENGEDGPEHYRPNVVPDSLRGIFAKGR